MISKKRQIQNEFKERIMEDPAEFESLIEEYIAFNFIERDFHFITHLIKDIPEKSEVADFGCGSGDIVLMLHTFRKDLYITGYDISSKMLALAKQKQQLNNIQRRISWEESDITKSLKNNMKYDYIYSHLTAHHMHSLNDFLFNIIASLKSKGKFLVRDFIRPLNHKVAIEIVNQISSKYCTDKQKKMIYDSLLSSFTLNEIREILPKMKANYKVKVVNEHPFLWEVYGWL